MSIETKPALTQAADIRAAYSKLIEKEPKLRTRDAATRLGISEATLVSTGAVNKSVTRLNDDFAGLVKRLGSLGTVMALTRNEYVVHEKIGVYDNIDVGPVHGIVLNHDIDLRLFMKQWASGFAISDETENGPRHSLHFFDRFGEAVHKIYLKSDDSIPAYQALVTAFKADTTDDSPVALDAGTRPAKTDQKDSAIDQPALHKDWAALEDTHDFVLLLKKHNVGRLQALRLAGDAFAVECPKGALTKAFEQAKAMGLSIMVFVGNDGCVQIHTGPVHNLKVMGPWFNVLDPTFNLHLRDDLISSVWLVRKPTVDGIVTSLEAYAADNMLILQMFGERKPGIEELTDWRNLAESLAAPKGAAA